MRLHETPFLHAAATARISSNCQNGYLSKKSSENSKWQTKWCVLFRNLMFYYERENSARPSGVVLLEGTTCQRAVMHDDGKQFAFTIGVANDKQPLIFASENESDCLVWISSISQSSMLRVEKDCVELQVKLQEVQKRLQAEQATKMEYQTFTEEQVITIKRLRDENFKLKKHIEELKMEKFKSSSENGTVKNSEEERLNALVSSVAHRWYNLTRWRKIIDMYVKSEHADSMKKRNRVLWQLMKSEEDYVSQLGTLVMCFYKPLKMAASSSHPPLSHAQLNLIFRNCETLYYIHQIFLQGLQVRMEKWPVLVLGDLFDMLLPLLVVYQDFVRNHATSLEVLTQCKHNHNFYTLLEKHENKPAAYGYSLEMYLTFPIQRIPGYVTLLNQLLAFTPPDHVERVKFEEARSKLQELSVVIYEQTSDSESMYKTLSIEKMISGGCHVLFDTNQHFVRQGMLRLGAVSSKSTVRKDVKLGPKHCFLFTNHMLITERIGEQLSINKEYGLVALNHCILIEEFNEEDSPDRTHQEVGFRMTLLDSSPDPRTITLVAECPRDKASWTVDISQCIENLQSETSSHSYYGRSSLSNDPRSDPRLFADGASIKYSLRMNSGQTPKVRYASLDKLLERLMDARFLGVEYLNTFLLTYRCFTDGHTVLGYIINTYYDALAKLPDNGVPESPSYLPKNNIFEKHSPPPRHSLTSIGSESVFMAAKYYSEVAMRVFNVIKSWISKYYQDFVSDPSLHQRLMMFLDQVACNESNMTQCGRKAVNIIHRSLALQEASSAAYPIGEIYNHYFNKSGDYSCLSNLAVDCEVMAQQLTILEHWALTEIAPKMLLKHGFNVNRESTSGTALHEAVLHGRLEVTQLLCDHGADVTIKNVHGQTPMDVAQKLSAAHSADKLAAIILKYQNQEAMVGQAMEECVPEQLTDLDVKLGELVHILSKNPDGRWRVFVIRRQVQKVGYVPWFKLELLSSLCKPATYMRASSQVLSERNTSNYGSLYSLASDYPAIPGNDRPHSVAVNGVSVTEQTARLLATPDVVVSYEDAQALLYEWLNNIGLGQHLSSFLDAGYDSPVLLAGITEAELKYVGITDPQQRRLLTKSASCLSEDNYLLQSTPDSVEDWLGALGLSTYSSLFAGAGYDYLGDMPRMTPTLLIKVGVTKPGHRTKILAAGVGLQKWIAEHPLPSRPEKFRPRKPARSISKTSNYSFDTSSPPVSAGLRLQDEPICSSFWETYPTEDSSVREEEEEEDISQSQQEDLSLFEQNLPPVDMSSVPSLSTNPFDTDEEDLAAELTSTIKPKRKKKPVDDGISTIQRERLFTLERQRSTPGIEDSSLSARKAPTLSPVSVETPPLSPGEAHWNSEDILGSSAHNVSYAGSGASNTSSDIIVHAEKRGSSEHLDPISPPPKTECEEDSLQDCVDLIRDPSPATSDSKRDSLHLAGPPSPKGYYETDIISISSPDDKDKENVIDEINPKKVLKRAATESAVIPRKDTSQDGICDSCKQKEKPLTVKERKQLFMEKLDQRMSGSDAMKATKKVPPPVAPKPKKYSFKKSTSEGHMTVTKTPGSPVTIITNGDSKPVDPIIEAPVISKTPVSEDMPIVEETPEIKQLDTSENISKHDQPPRASRGSVFDDLENMFDEFSKELDSFLT